MLMLAHRRRESLLPGTRPCKGLIQQAAAQHPEEPKGVMGTEVV